MGSGAIISGLVERKVFDYERVPSIEVTFENDGRAISVNVEVLGLGTFDEQTPWYVTDKETLDESFKEFMDGMDIMGRYIDNMDHAMHEVAALVADYLDKLVWHGVIRRRL